MKGPCGGLKLLARVGMKSLSHLQGVGTGMTMTPIVILLSLPPTPVGNLQHTFRESSKRSKKWAQIKEKGGVISGLRKR